jgi:pyroglutamyl-peptidase
MSTILVTGFGPFPGSPYNPTGPLVRQLARLRRPRLAHINIVPHTFPTSYAAVDRELPLLLAEHKPDALLMFGLAPRARVLRIEILARNTVSLRTDAGTAVPRRLTILSGGPPALRMPAPARSLLAAVGATGVPATLSYDAGRYLCNYLAWRASEAAGKPGGPHLAAFVHVPNVARFAQRPTKRRRLTLSEITRACTAPLVAVADACRVPRKTVQN